LKKLLALAAALSLCSCGGRVPDSVEEKPIPKYKFPGLETGYQYYYNPEYSSSGGVYLLDTEATILFGSTYPGKEFDLDAARTAYKRALILLQARQELINGKTSEW
jgi:hypothetical protein